MGIELGTLIPFSLLKGTQKELWLSIYFSANVKVFF